MKKLIHLLTISFFLLYPILNFSQVGIETNFPRNPLTVKGIIQSTQDGFQFPDGSVQHKAAPESVPGNAAEGRYVIVMEAHGIAGSYNSTGFTDAMQVIDFKWGVYHNLVPDSLLLAGPRIHKVLTVTKNIDRGSVPLIQRMIDGLEIPDVTLYFLKFGPGGTPAVYYEIRLEMVKVISFDQAGEFKDDGSVEYAHMERISFSFETIIWDWYGGEDYSDNLLGGGPSDGMIMGLNK